MAKMSYRWITVCLAALIVTLAYCEAAEDVPLTVTTKEIIPANENTGSNEKLLPPDPGSIQETSPKLNTTPKDPAQQSASDPQVANADGASQPEVQVAGADANQNKTSVVVSENTDTAANQPPDVGSVPIATSNSSGDVPKETLSQTNDQQTSSQTSDQQASNATSDQQASNPTGGQQPSNPAGGQQPSNPTGDQQASNPTGDQAAPSTENENKNKSVSQDVIPANNQGTNISGDVNSETANPTPKKTYENLCDNCTCPDQLLQNPYIINCTGSLPGQYLPHWDTFLETATDSDVDNVHLILELNGFESIAEIKQCNVIDSISFSFNEIKSIEPKAFANLPDLKRLLISYNQLKEIHSEAFATKDSSNSPIEVLDLSYNYIHYLDNNIFDAMHNLIELNLEGNPFSVLDSSTVTALNSLHSLEYLNLANTGLENLPAALINPVRHLDRLNLAYNKLTSIPEVLQKGQNLVELILSGNLMENFNAASFIELINVKVLNISDMPNLKIIYKGTFFPLQSLKVLNCNDNPKLGTIELRSFHDDSNPNKQYLDKLELRNNNLRTLDKEMFVNIDIGILDVRYNPYECSCEIAWVQTDERTYIHLNETKCASPESVEGMLIRDVDFETAQVPCPDGYRDHASFIDINYVLTESFGFWIFALLVGLVILVAIATIVIRSKPELQYKIMRVVSPQRAEYRDEKFPEKSSNVRYMRQLDDDQGFSEDVITEYSITDRSNV